GTILNLLRWKRWMMIGIATAAIPAIRAAFRNVMLPPSRRRKSKTENRKSKSSPPGGEGGIRIRFSVFDFRFSASSPHPEGEVLGQSFRVRLIRHHRHQVDAVAVAAVLELRAPLLEVFQIGGPQVVRVDEVLLPVHLQAVEAGPGPKVEV